MFLKLDYLGSKHQHRFQGDSSFTKLWKLAPSTPTPHFTSLDMVKFRWEFGKSFAGFQRVKVLKY